MCAVTSSHKGPSPQTAEHTEGASRCASSRCKAIHWWLTLISQSRPPAHPSFKTNIETTSVTSADRFGALGGQRYCAGILGHALMRTVNSPRVPSRIYFHIGQVGRASIRELPNPCPRRLLLMTLTLMPAQYNVRLRRIVTPLTCLQLDHLLCTASFTHKLAQQMVTRISTIAL